MRRLKNQETDVTTVFGRVVSGLRRELGHSQARLAKDLNIDKSLLARVEIGRNMATIDNVMKLEEEFIAAELLEEHGDLVHLTSRATRALKRRGARVVYGKATEREGVTLVELTIMDRVISGVLDRWWEEIEADEEEDGNEDAEEEDDDEDGDEDDRDDYDPDDDDDDE